MSSSSQKLQPYESLKKYIESVIQCPMCHYYIKINPQTDSMKYRILSRQQIHFLTIHEYNSEIHSIVVEYLNFSFSRIIDFSDKNKEQGYKDFFPIYHLVNVGEYKTFRNRILELESNNNDLISSFKTKLDTLETTYKQTELKNTFQSRQIEELDALRLDYESEMSNKLIELDSLKEILKEKVIEQEALSSEIKKLQEQLGTLGKENINIKNTNIELKTKIEAFFKEREQNDGKKDIQLSDEKLMNLLSEERHQKRDAVKEKKVLKEQVQQLTNKMNIVEEKFLFEQELKDKALNELKNLKEQFEHSLTLDYEKKISELTLALQDREEQIKMLQNAKDTSLKRTSTKFDKSYRQEIADLFIKIQKTFNMFQYDLLLSFYDTAQLDNQIRNAFEKFFGQLIQKTNSIGRVLLSDDQFSLFHDMRELNARLKFSEEQQQASLQLQALDIVLSELLVYIFAIIKAMKAESEADNFAIIPDDAEISAIIDVKITEEKIGFKIPLSTLTSFENIRVFRPTSELYKNSFVFITKDADSTLSNNNYQLLPFEINKTETEVILQIPKCNFEDGQYQIGSFYDGQYLIIQKIDFQQQFDYIKSFTEKNKLKFYS